MKSDLIALIPSNIGRTINLVERNQLYLQNDSQIHRQRISSQADVKWLTEKFFGKRANLSRYLKSSQIDPALILSLLETPSTDTSFLDGAWKNMWTVQDQAAQHSSKDEQSSTPPAFTSIELLCGEAFGFALRQMADILKGDVERGHKIDESGILQDFRNHLYHSLNAILTPSVILETNLARLKSKAGLSEDRTPRSFTDNLADFENRKRFWSKYPVLWRLVSTVVHNTISSCEETIARISDDRTKIADTFGIGKDDVLTSIAWGSGDAHREGRVVAILSFGNTKLVYKPRPVAIDRAYNQFIAWYASIDKADAPERYRILDCETHGYVEFVQAKACDSQDEIRAFYKKLGLLIAASWLLGITDLHHENVIASGANPYLVDVEAMLDRPIRHRKKKQTFNDLYSQASRDLLFRTGLLPARMKGVTGIFDVSAIGASGDQPAPVEVMTVENFGSDEVKLVAKQGCIFQSQNSPAPHNPEHKPHHYTNEIVAGFEHAMSVLHAQKTFLLGDDSVLKSFTGLEVRWVARATMDYGKLLEKMVHPTVLGDAIQCEMLMAGELSSAIDFVPHLAPVISSEVADLWNYDVPYFWSLSDSTDLHDSKGKTYKGFFEESGIVGIRKRLESLNIKSLAKSDAITLALKSTASAHDHINVDEIKGSVNSGAFSPKNMTPDALINIAAEIGQRLIAKAHYIGRVPFWSGLTPLDDKNYTVGVLAPNLYDGATGVGLFMAYLYQETKNKMFKKVALDVHHHIGFLLRTKSGVSSAGAFSGLASLLYADFHISSVLGLDSRKRYDRPFQHLKRLAETDTSFDIISGTAGALIVSLRYYQHTGSQAAYAAATAAAERLGLSAEPQKIGIAWDTMKSFNFSEKLGGVSHGVSGIAWALAEWATCTGDDKWSAFARQAFAYEQSLFDPEAGAWKDVRNGSHSCFWCYGAAGIGLVADKVRGTLGNFVCDEVMSQAKEATLKAGSTGNHGLCHGDLGNAEIFRVAGDQTKADALVFSVIDDYKKNGEWKCGLPDGAIASGLMCGLAGIGYGLLRHARPKTVPNILSLDFPLG